ncbi:MAG: peptide chain release factor-like protein [Candidatus Latescibacterota bacterium]|nr:peptide chain release factor-like protein [Candidatus Latescibacterota bacterium]
MTKPADRQRLELETRIQTFRSGGPGGQHRNKVESAVRLTHIPTGITVVAAEHRSQIRNRDLAFERLTKRLLDRGKRPPKRRPTRPSLASKKKRIDQKKRRAQIKHLRRPF